MIFIRSFKGYEDKIRDLDANVNQWIAKNKVDVVAVQTALAHEPGSKAGTGDLIYTVVYRSEQPLDY